APAAGHRGRQEDGARRSDVHREVLVSVDVQRIRRRRPRTYLVPIQCLSDRIINQTAGCHRDHRKRCVSSEASCLSVVQWNEKHDLVSGMCLCNYPNVPAVTPEDWPCWLQTLYGGRVREPDDQNSAQVPVELVPVAVVARGLQERHGTQAEDPEGRRSREEDNDIVIPLIDAESTLLKERYGEYYVSEMVRYPNDFRHLIVSEDKGGLATGVMFLSNRVDVDMLNENFELALYNGLRKPHKHDIIPDESFEPASKTFCSVFTEKPVEALYSPQGTLENLRPNLHEDELPTSLDRSTVDFGEVAGSSSSSSYAYDVDTAKKSESAANYDDNYRAFFRWSMLVHGIMDSTDTIPRKGVSRDTVQEKTEDIEIQLPPQPIYQGQPNAFVVEVFAIDDQVEQRCCTIFLEAAFECFPGMDYCTILVPSDHPELSFLRNFVRVPVKCNRDFPMALYVTHRAALLGDIRTRWAGPQDRDDVETLLQKIPKAQTILEDFDEAVKKGRSDLFCYVFTWNDRIVGVAIFWYLESIFSDHLCVKSGFQTRSQPLPICLNSMVHVQPRRRIEYRFRGLVETDQPKTVSEPFSLFMTTPRMLSDTSLVHDTKIVVIGASDCGVALLEHLAFGAPHDSTRYANVTLISPRGLPFENERSSAVASMIPFHGRYCHEHRRLVAARTWINVVYGTVVEVNRKEKHVTVMNRGNITYDYLVVTCGLQYQKPQFQEELDMIKRGTMYFTNFLAPLADREWKEQETPWNCLAINDDTQAVTCLEKIRLLTKNFEDESETTRFLLLRLLLLRKPWLKLRTLSETIVLYGRSIDCYCALQGLLESGMDGSWITLIEPPMHPCDSHKSVFFNDCEVHAVAMTHILDSGVSLLQEWEIIDWYLHDSTKGGMIEALVLRSKGSIKIVRCDALIAFHEKTIDPKIFLAFCKAGLMYDGMLVIDSEFRTNDPFVFAAGNSTKYSRKFYAASWEHRYYNSVEIGERVSTAEHTISPHTNAIRLRSWRRLRSIIVKQQRYGEKAVKPCKRKKYFPFSSFRAPNIVACTLPGGYRYLHVRKPGKIPMSKHPNPLDTSVSYRDGTEMVTGSCDSEIGYFRLRLDRYDIVETITCFSREDFEVHQMIRLYGKHESLLNELKTRFQDSLISDFFAYFREPWATALFIDRFDCLRMENRATLLSKTAVPGESLIEDCIRALKKTNWKSMEVADRRRIVAKYAGSVYHQRLEESLLKFLQFSEEDAPVYCTPGKLQELYADLEDSPLYTDV
ncbi:LOW QUALITY PROTEIN: cilia- and flagella-associated protein 61, partial [Halictus rubicundus]|uniref:LOW QUALITY PROTEIN: cilia- and flagella-associated protein 61 n=1 Tax=Halictus rubicundus TaxID=77578 RepID=UPI00403755DE